MIDKDLCSNFTDEELVTKILADQAFYCCIVERFEGPLKRYVKRITILMEAEVEDVLQDVFLKAYLNLNDFDTSLKFSSWLYRIAHNEVISNYRKRTTRRLDDTTTLDNLQELSANFSHEINFDLKITTKELNSVLVELDEKYREVLVLKFLEEKDYNEISDILQKPLGTVATLINRAKKQFRLVAESKKIVF